VQYNELGGIQDREVPGGSGNPDYTAALQVLDSDMPQYIHDNTDDEITHFTFLNAYLASKGADTVNLEPVPQFARQQSDRFERKAAPDESDAAHSRYELVDSISQQHEQPRPRPEFRISAGGPRFV
jgi:hypothetical protein